MTLEPEGLEPEGTAIGSVDGSPTGVSSDDASENARVNAPSYNFTADVPSDAGRFEVVIDSNQVHESGVLGGDGGPGDVIAMIEIGMVSPGAYQPRRKMDEASLIGLATSIRRSGMMQPVLVRPVAGAHPDGPARYELVAGERRWRAAQRAGLSRIPALVRHLSDEEAAEQALVENVQREDLPTMDRAWALRRMAERFGLTQTELADRVGLERSSVANLQRLTELEPQLQELIDSSALSMGHGKVLLSCEPGKRRIDLGTQAANSGWSVRKLEHLAKHPSSVSSSGGRSPATVAARPAVHEEIEKRLAEHMGTRVRLRTDKAGKKGVLTLDFYDLDHFEGLMQKMGFDTHRL